MKCSWQTFLSPLKGQCPQYALIGLSQTTRLTGGFDFVITQVHNCKILAHSETFQHLGNNPTRLLFHSFFLSKTHLILLSPIDTPQKTPPIVCFLKKRRAIVCTLAHESKKSCTRFLGCMIFTLYHQRYDCGKTLNL